MRHSPPAPAPCEQLRRQSRHALLLAALGALLTLPVYGQLGPLWHFTQQQHGTPLLLAALGFGLLLVLGPLLLICGSLAALFLRIEASLNATPLQHSDRAVIALGITVTLLPALAACYPPLQALASGHIRYKFPATQISRHLDPLAYWQGIAFWLMGASALAWLAFVYWRSRWHKYQAQRPSLAP